MKIFRKSYSHRIKASIEEAWSFFSDPSNLARITPKEMGFEILSEKSKNGIYPGQLIYYSVKPLLGIKMSWVTEITAVREGQYFIDYQYSGPYRLWHHEHRFYPDGDGIRMEDTIHYSIPLGFLGSLMNRLLISKKIDRIFDYRRGVLDKLFGS